MLFDPTRHEALLPIPWDEAQVRACIAHIVADTELHFSAHKGWPLHPLDGDPAATNGVGVPPLYQGSCGVIWALHYLQDVGAAKLRRRYLDQTDALLASTRAWLGEDAQAERASYLMGETPIELLAYGASPSAAAAHRLHALIAGNLEHPLGRAVPQHGRQAVVATAVV